MLDVRLRISELMNRKDSKIRTAYALSQESGLSMTNAYHLVKADGRVERIELETLAKLKAAFGVRIQDLFADD
jgi:DNA-binding Xre family transcriptional regulator